MRRQVLLKSFIAGMMISFMVPLYTFAYDQYESMNVGETKTFYFPSEVTNRASMMYSYNCSSDHINNVEVVSYTNTSVTVKALAYTSSQVNIRFDYWWYENNYGRHDTHMVHIDLNGDGGGGNTESDYNPYNYDIDYGSWGTINVEEGSTTTVYCQYNIPDPSKVKSILWSDYYQICYEITSQSSSSCTIIGRVASSGGKLWCLMKYGNTSYKAYYTVNVKESTKQTLSLTANPDGGKVDKGKIVYLTASNTSADIYYTLNGSTPTASSTKYTSSGIAINEDCTLKAFAQKSGYNDSPVMTWVYTVKKSPVTSITLNKTSLSLVIGESETLIATVKPDNATDKSVTWSSDNKSVATVDNDGKVTAIANGSATITCTANDGSGVFATCNAIVTKYKDGAIITTTVNGVDMRFQVISNAELTCRVYYNAIGMDISGSISIPSEVENYKVVEICSSAFENCTNISSVNLPSSVREIGSRAFNGCSSLESITGLNSIEYIEPDYAFGSTPWYKNLPDGLIYIGKVLYEYRGEMPSNTTISVKEGTTQIYDNALRSQICLVGINIPSSVITIESNPFSGCGNLKSIIVEEGNPMYDSRDNCNAVIETASNTLIAACKTTVIPSTVKGIGSYAYWCSSMFYSLRIPDNIEIIKERAFYGTGLSSITFGCGMTKAEDHILMSNDHMKAIHVLADTPFEITEKTFDYDYNHKDKFYNDAILYVPIGSRLNYMYTEGWSKFKNIVETDGSSLCVGDVLTCNSAEGQLLYFVVTNTSPKTCRLIGIVGDGEITIPETVDDCTVTEIAEPIANTTVGEYMKQRPFIQRSNITKVSIPNTVTIIPIFALRACQDLEIVVLPQSVESIGERAFEMCPKLLSIYSNSSTPVAINEKAFSEETYNMATLYVPIGTMSKYKSTEGWKNFKNIVEYNPSGVSTMMMDENAGVPVYTLFGQRLAAPRKGINIVGGKKVIVK